MYISENQRISLFVLSIDFHFRILILEKIRTERILSKRTFASMVKLFNGERFTISFLVHPSTLCRFLVAFFNNSRERRRWLAAA